MKKNILTIIILAMAFINIVMSALIIFVIVPTSNKTNNLVTKVASIIDLELESPKEGDTEIAVSDITTYDIPDQLQINLKKSDDVEHFALLNVSLSINKNHENTVEYEPLIAEYDNSIKEIVTEEFQKYTIEEVTNNKKSIKEQVLTRIQDLFKSDFIINVSFGNIKMQ